MKLYIEGGELIDSIAPESRPNPGVFVQDGLIQSVEDRSNPTGETQTIDAGGMTIMPGLIDAHLHLMGIPTIDFTRTLVAEPLDLCAIRAAMDASVLLQSGFTTVRSVGSAVEVAVRNAVREGVVSGPTILAAGLMICQTGGHGDVHTLPPSLMSLPTMPTRLADGPVECRKAVREQLRKGVDLIKIHVTGGINSEHDDPSQTQFTPEEVRAITDEAHRAGRRVAAHAESWPGVRLALDCGVDTIEHGMMLNEETCVALAESGVPIVTTFTINELSVSMLEERGLARNLEKLNEVRKHYAESIRMARELGVRIAVGTDIFGAAPLSHGRNALELDYLHRLTGMSPMETIQAATAEGAEALGLAGRVGAIAPGMDADMVIVRKNPLEDLQSLLVPENIAYVIKKGVVVRGPV